MKKTTAIGTILSFFWLSFFGWLLYYKQSTLNQLTLNEWGDFFAGFMAPLALIWLVLGYIQQGEELRLNTEALKAQQEELSRQVAEAAALAKHAERQARASEELARTTSRQHRSQMVNRFREHSKENHSNNKSDE